jgi:hypothetical protein
MDRSYFEMIELLISPLREEFEPPWNYVRLFFWGILPITMISIVMLLTLEHSEATQRAITFLKNLAIIGSITAGCTYLICAWHAHSVIQVRKHERERGLRAFRD